MEARWRLHAVSLPGLCEGPMTRKDMETLADLVAELIMDRLAARALPLRSPEAIGTE